MDKKSEDKAAESARRHAEEFRRRHKVSEAEWALAEAMDEDGRMQRVRDFWEVYDSGDGRRNGNGALPGSGMAAEVRSANGPAEEAARASLRTTRKGRTQRS